MSSPPSGPGPSRSSDARTLVKIAGFGGVIIATVFGFQSYRIKVEATEAQEQLARDNPPSPSPQTCQIKIGTIASEVVRCWGTAPDVRRSETQDTKIQHWFYPDGRYLMFVNGKVWKMESR